MSALDVAKEVKVEIEKDNLVVASAGVAFFTLLSLVPALVALVSVYGIFADPDDVRTQIDDLLSSAPTEVRDFFSTQLADLAGGSSGGLGLSAVISLAIAMWSASTAVKHLIAALNTVEDVTETRGGIVLRLISLLFIFGGIVVFCLVVSLMGVLPALLGASGLATESRVILSTLRFPLVGLIVVLSLAVLYHLGPDLRERGRFRPFPLGALVAAGLFVVASGLFSVYTSSVGRLNQTYAATGGLVVLLLWLFIAVGCVMFGAEVESIRRARRARATPEVAPAAPVAPSATAAALLGFAAGALIRRR